MEVSSYKYEWLNHQPLVFVGACSVAQSFLTLCNPVDRSLPGFSAHGIFQAKILEWDIIYYSKGSSWLRDRTRVSCVSCIDRQILYHWCHLEASWWIQGIRSDRQECLKNYGRRFVTWYRSQWSKPFPRKRNAKRQNGCLRRPCKQLRREVNGKGEKERFTHLNAEFQRIARRDKKGFLSNQCKDIEENNRMGKTRDPSKNLEIPRGHFMQRWAQ